MDGVHRLADKCSLTGLTQQHSSERFPSSKADKHAIRMTLHTVQALRLPQQCMQLQTDRQARIVSVSTLAKPPSTGLKDFICGHGLLQVKAVGQNACISLT